MTKPLTIYIIAGEPSGDLLASHLMRELKSQADNVKFYGVGGPRMEAEGLKSLFAYYELSMMGFVEILPYIFNLSARINQTVEDIMAKEPDIVITVDSPGFCFRVVERLRKNGLKSKFVHYVAPTVWVYKPERAERCARLFDHILLLLPFEPPYFEKVGLPCTYVGHPVVAETKAGNGKAFREKYELSDTTPLFCLLPGSRRGEVRRHMPIFARTITMLASRYPDLAIAVAVPKHVMAFVAPFFEKCPFRAIVTANEDDKKDAIAASNLAITKSGTVALEVAMAGTPMLVAYRVNPISAWMFRRVCIAKYANIINVLHNKPIIPELLQEQCTSLTIASAADALLQDEKRRTYQINQTQDALKQMVPTGPNTPSALAAQTVLNLLK